MGNREITAFLVTPMDWSSCFFPQTDSISRCASATWECCDRPPVSGKFPQDNTKPTVHGKKLIKYQSLLWVSHKVSKYLKVSQSIKHPIIYKTSNFSIQFFHPSIFPSIFFSDCLSFPSIFPPTHGKLHLQPRRILRPRRRKPCRPLRRAAPLRARGLGAVADSLQAPRKRRSWKRWDFVGGKIGDVWRIFGWFLGWFLGDFWGFLVIFEGFWRSKNRSNPWVFKRKPSKDTTIIPWEADSKHWFLLEKWNRTSPI